MLKRLPEASLNRRRTEWQLDLRHLNNKTQAEFMCIDVDWCSVSVAPQWPHFKRDVGVADQKKERNVQFFQQFLLSFLFFLSLPIVLDIKLWCDGMSQFFFRKTRLRLSECVLFWCSTRKCSDSVRQLTLVLVICSQPFAVLAPESHLPTWSLQIWREVSNRRVWKKFHKT